MMLCAKCGGGIVAAGRSFYGKRCSCKDASAAGAAVATMTDASASMSVGHKLCCKCGADVTHAKRMKDHVGRYWCYECGAADQLKRGAGLALRCPDCQKHFPPTKMLKHGEAYLCEDCHAERATPKRMFAAAGSGAVTAKVLLALLMVGVGALMIAAYVLDLEIMP
jgi:hypothetical protein